MVPSQGAPHRMSQTCREVPLAPLGGPLGLISCASVGLMGGGARFPLERQSFFFLCSEGCIRANAFSVRTGQKRTTPQSSREYPQGTPTPFTGCTGRWVGTVSNAGTARGFTWTISSDPQD